MIQLQKYLLEIGSCQLFLPKCNMFLRVSQRWSLFHLCMCPPCYFVTFHCKFTLWEINHCSDFVSFHNWKCTTFVRIPFHWSITTHVQIYWEVSILVWIYSFGLEHLDVAMVHSRGLGRRLGGHWDGSVSATRIGLGRYAQNAT